MNNINYKQDGIEVNQNIGDANYALADPFISLLSPFNRFRFPSSNLIKLQPRKVNFQPNTLGNTTHIYSTPLYVDIIALADYFADWGCSYDIQEGSTHIITVQIPWDTISNEDFFISDFVSEQWEIVPNMEHKSLLVNGMVINPFLPPSTPNNYVVLPDILKVSLEKAFENKNLAIIPPHVSSSVSIAPFLPYAQQFLDYMRGGVESVPTYTQTLKRTAVIDVRNQNRAFKKAVDEAHSELNANGTINFMYSQQDMIRKYDILDTVSALMLPSYTKKITVNTVSSFQYYSYAGWLVKPPTFQFMSRNKVQLTQEFYWNEWLGGMYFINSPIAHFPLITSAAASPTGTMPAP